ncbi:MAG TPA: hypothetical protein VJG66_04540 [Patescibacteria group bacterium]|nr:hypothetical protein [Patescibacteria group bacterium]
MTVAPSSEREGLIYVRGRKIGPVFGVRRIVGVEDLRRQVWTGYSAGSRINVLQVLDRALRHIEVFARKGAVVRGTGFMDPLRSLEGLSVKLDRDLAEQGLLVMQVHEMNERYRLGLRIVDGYHPKIWMSIAGPGLVSGLVKRFRNGGLEMDYRGETNFDKTLGGLARHIENLFDFGLPPGVRQPFSGLEITNLRLYQLAQKYGQADN